MSTTVMIDDASDCLLQRYRLVATLDGHKGPINCFAFNNNGSLLASGGKPPACI
jgi:WD40 repeat protein